MSKRTIVRTLILLLSLVFAAAVSAQTVDVDRVARELEPAILKTMGDGNISSVAVALVSGDQIVWKKA